VPPPRTRLPHAKARPYGAATLYVVAGPAALNAWPPAARDAARADTGAATR